MEVQRVNFFFPLLIAQSLHRLHMGVSGMEEGKTEKLSVGKAAFHTLNLHIAKFFPPPSKLFCFLVVYLTPKEKTLLIQPESFSVESPPPASKLKVQ